MRVIVTGATGFVGRALCLALVGRGDEVVAVTRSAARAHGVLGGGVEIVEASGGEDLRHVVSGADAVVHLAGAGIIDRRWTRSRKKELVSSRVEYARHLVSAMAESDVPPRVFVSASAVGYYGDTASTVVDEAAPAGDDFLASLCRRWEAAASRATAHGVRVVAPRFGVVLGAGGGLWDKIASPSSMGLAAVLGSGEQYVSWIHLDDLIGLLLLALDDERVRGPINAVAPEPVSNDQLTRAVAAALGAKVRLRIPAALLELGLGEGATAVLASQRVRPARALELGYPFRHQNIEQATRALADTGVLIRRARSLPASPYLDQRGARYVLEQTTYVDAPVDEVFEFFANAENLAAMTPTDMSFDIRTETPIEMGEGVEIDYRIAIGPAPMSWRTRIDSWNPGRSFVDVQLEGPYRSWWHEHGFEPAGRGTKMTDRVFYRVPFGPIGWLAHRIFVGPKLRRVFEFRRSAISMRFRGTRLRLAA